MAFILYKQFLLIHWWCQDKGDIESSFYLDLKKAFVLVSIIETDGE